MSSFTSFNASGLPEAEVGGILADYLALDQARVFRRLFVVRFGALTLAALAAGFVIHGLSLFARWVPVAVFATPPVWAWVAELRLSLRLSARLHAIEDKKVVKSS